MDILYWFFLGVASSLFVLSLLEQAEEVRRLFVFMIWLKRRW